MKKWLQAKQSNETRVYIYACKVCGWRLPPRRLHVSLTPPQWDLEKCKNCKIEQVFDLVES